VSTINIIMVYLNHGKSLYRTTVVRKEKGWGESLGVFFRNT